MTGFEAKFMLPCSFSEETAAEKYMAQAQHNSQHRPTRLVHDRHGLSQVLAGEVVSPNRQSEAWNSSLGSNWQRPPEERVLVTNRP
jgi:hypothetical protein